MRLLFSALIASALIATGCDSTPTTPTRTPAPPSVVETFEGTLKVSGASFFSFTTTQYGTINLTLNSLTVENEPSAAMLALAIGQPAGVDCLVSTSQTTAAGSTPQVTGTFEPSVYCAKITDVAPLPAPGVFNITIAHP
jgi:hypothetical protein